MRRRIRARMLAGALVLAGGMGLEVPLARAQFPVFYGGQVLTPFGNRGSDGSYLNRRQAPRVRRFASRPRAYAYPAQPRYYSVQPRYYSVQPGYNYAAPAYPSSYVSRYSR
jgi:hypothetical protein